MEKPSWKLSRAAGRTYVQKLHRAELHPAEGGDNDVIIGKDDCELGMGLLGGKPSPVQET